MSTAMLPPLPVIPNVEVRHIPGWPGYAVSDDGRVFTCRNQRTPERCYKSYWRPLRQSPRKHGYLAVYMTREKYEKHTFLVHRLVLAAFIGSCPPSHEACHGDGDTQNNCLFNLRWGTKIENAIDKRHHRKNPHKYTEDQVKKVFTLRQQGMSYQRIANTLYMSRWVVQDIIYKKTWKHINP